MTAKTGTGTPTGMVSLVDNDAAAFSNALGAFTLSGAVVSTSLSNLPGGTYQLVAQYAGDAVFGASASTPVTVTVGKENDTLGVTGWVLNPLDNRLYPTEAGMSVPYGAQVFLDAQPQGVNGGKAALGQFTPASGAVTFVDKWGLTGSQTAVKPLDSEGVAEWTPGSLAPGTHAISASYGGDASYNASWAPTAASLTIFRGTTTVAVRPLETSIAAGGSLTVDVALTSSYQTLVGALPGGRVSVTLEDECCTASGKSWDAGERDGEAAVMFTYVRRRLPAVGELWRPRELVREFGDLMGSSTA